MNAATPPRRCASAMTCWQTVVLPDDSGPKISVIRPRGMPPTPSARSSAIDPDGMMSTCCRSAEPSFMIEPRPNCFSIASIAASTALVRSAPLAGLFRSVTAISSRSSAGPSPATEWTTKRPSGGSAFFLGRIFSVRGLRFGLMTSTFCGTSRNGCKLGLRLRRSWPSSSFRGGVDLGNPSVNASAELESSDAAFTRTALPLHRHSSGWHAHAAPEGVGRRSRRAARPGSRP